MDFTALFTETLNKTIADLVAQAVRSATVELQQELAEARSEIADLQRFVSDFEMTSIEGQVEDTVERAIENYDFRQIVRDNIDVADILEDSEFASAVKEVIVSGLQ